MGSDNLEVLPDLKVTIIGLRDAGKTTLVKRLKGNEVIETVPTMGVNLEILKIPLDNDKFLDIQVFDLGGQDTHLVKLWRPFIRQATGVIFVFDSANKNNIDQVKIWLDQSVFWCSIHKPFLFLANKQDLPQSLSTKEIIDLLALEKYLNESPRPFAIYKCSALTGEGVNEPWKWLSEQLLHIAKKKDKRS